MNQFQDLLLFRDYDIEAGAVIVFKDVELLRDFGPFKRGQKLYSLYLDSFAEEVSSFDEDGKFIEGCGMKLEAVE